MEQTLFKGFYLIRGMSSCNARELHIGSPASILYRIDWQLPERRAVNHLHQKLDNFFFNEGL